MSLLREKCLRAYPSNALHGLLLGDRPLRLLDAASHPFKKVIVGSHRVCRAFGISPSLPATAPAGPVLLGLAPDRRRRLDLHLHPAVGAARAVGGAEPLRYDAFAAEGASVAVDNRTVDLEVLIEGDARMPAWQVEAVFGSVNVFRNSNGENRRRRPRRALGD